MDAGGPRPYHMDESLYDVLGQAVSIRVHGFVYEKTDSDAKAILKFYESSLDGIPLDKGTQIGSDIDLSSVGATYANVQGPFCGRVQAVLEIKDGNATPANQKKLHIEVGLTLILDS
jgi:hypothetical protein